MADSTPKSYSIDPILYLYTSLTAGSSHVVTATSRLETILKANKIPFRAIDIATDEKARMLWGRRSGKDESGRVRKLPGLVQMGLVVGDLVEIEDWNEYGELKEHVKIVPIDGTPAKPAAATPSGTPSKLLASHSTAPTPSSTPSKASKSEETTKSESIPESTKQLPAGATPTAFTLAMRQAGEQAAEKAKQAKNKLVEVFDGTGEAEPSEFKASDSTTKDLNQSATIPPPTVIISGPSADGPISDTTASLQSPTSTAWKRFPGKEEAKGKEDPACELIEKLEHMQSPTSTAWKPADMDAPVTRHRGSEISVASVEEVREIEKSQVICEEDEEAVEE